MNTLRRIIPWLGTLVVIANIAIFILIASRYLSSPTSAAAEFGITFSGPAGANSLRVGFGAFPLAFVTLLATALITRRRRTALAMVATVMGTAAIVRAAGLAIDGPSTESLRLLAPEVVMLLLSLACLAIERGSHPDHSAGPPQLELGEGSMPGRLRRRLGVGLLGMIVLALAVSGFTKLVGVPAVVDQIRGFGFEGLVPLVALLELASAALLFLPATRPAGLAFASSFLGGAVATHLQHERSPRVLAPAILLGLLWLGAWLRHPELAPRLRVTRRAGAGRESLASTAVVRGS